MLFVFLQRTEHLPARTDLVAAVDLRTDQVVFEELPVALKAFAHIQRPELGREAVQLDDWCSVHTYLYCYTLVAVDCGCLVDIEP